jgi:lysylphosphatidylglycerol synthetase-like protein (DUF2156 family)
MPQAKRIQILNSWTEFLIVDLITEAKDLGITSLESLFTVLRNVLHN